MSVRETQHRKRSERPVNDGTNFLGKGYLVSFLASGSEQVTTAMQLWPHRSGAIWRMSKNSRLHDRQTYSRPGYTIIDRSSPHSMCLIMKASG